MVSTNGLSSQAADEISRLGFSILPSALPSADVERLTSMIADAVTRTEANGAFLQSRGVVYAARNLLADLPEIATAWRQSILIDLLTEVLGPDFGMVRCLFFDKPPERSWSLPWHKDLSIAVADNSLPSGHFMNPTVKAGVPHVIASVEVLERMLTLRIHLDDVTDENGPLQVIPASHMAGKATLVDPASPVTIYARRGDVLAMRPLVSHASGNSHDGTSRHRRILHLEFAASRELPDGYRWHTFLQECDYFDHRFVA